VNFEVFFVRFLRAPFFKSSSSASVLSLTARAPAAIGDGARVGIMHGLTGACDEAKKNAQVRALRGVI
jgi:hypothetical protein